MTALGVAALVCVAAVGALWLWLRFRQWDAAESRRHELAVYEAQAVRMRQTVEEELRQAISGLEGRLSKLELGRSLGGR